MKRLSLSSLLSILSIALVGLTGCTSPSARQERQKALQEVSNRNPLAVTRDAETPGDVPTDAPDGEPAVVQGIADERFDFEDIHTVSLRSLQETLHACKARSDCAEDIHLDSLNWLMGYVVDRAHSDLLLFGYFEEGRPPLYADDLVVALRNAMRFYARREGNTTYYSFPGCTIDPDPQTMQRLDAIGARIQASSREGVEKELKQWNRTCVEPQNVGVMGVPFDTRFARVMVEADYDMKRIVDASDTLNLPGFQSLIDMKLAKVRQALLQNKPAQISTGMNRFWFYPGPNRYEVGDDLVMLSRSPVYLGTKRMGASGGELLYSTSADPMAEVFTDGFSKLYRQVAEVRPIYQELENLYRFVAVAQMMTHKAAFSAYRADFNYLLQEYPVAAVPIKRQLPGRSAIKSFENRKDLDNGYQIAKFWMPSCGGVDIGIQVNEQQLVERKTSYFTALKNAVLRTGTPNQTRKRRKKRNSDLNTGESLRTKNQFAENYSVLKIESADEDAVLPIYKVSSGYADPFVSEGFPELMQALHDQKAGMLNTTWSFDIRSLPREQHENFIRNVRTQAEKYDEVHLQFMTTEVQDLVADNGFEYVGAVSDIKQETQGRFKDWFYQDHAFKKQFKGKIRDLIVRLWARSRDKMVTVGQQFRNYLSGTDYTSSLLDNLLGFRRTYDLLYDDEVQFHISVKDQVGSSETAVRDILYKWRFG